MGEAAPDFSVDGVDVHIDGEGTDTIVMVHGWPDTWRLWDRQVAVLRERFRCVRFTLPGFDVTRPRRAVPLDEMVRSIAAIVDHVSPDRPVTLLLHDWGCLFGYHYVQTHPARVARVVGVDIGDTRSPEQVAALSWRAKLGTVAYQWTLAAAWLLPEAIGTPITQRLARAFGSPTPTEQVGAQMNYPYWIAWSGRHGSYRAAKPFWPQVPMLFIYGTRKPFMFHSPAWLERLRADPRHAVVAIEHGHWMMHYRAEAFNAALLGWLARTPV